MTKNLPIRSIPIAQFVDERGSLFALEHLSNLPFELRRIFILKDVNFGHERARHAVSSEEFFVMLSGKCKMEIKSKEASDCFELSDNNTGIYVPAGIWIRLFDFSENASLLVACSKKFDETKYFPEPQI